MDAVGMAMIDAAQVDNGSFDDCGIDTIFIDRTQFTCDDLGENMVVLTVIDNENEMSTTTATITVMDTLGPNVITQDATVYMNEIGLASLSAAEVDNGSTDNCGIDTMYISAEQFNCLALGDNEITLTVVDNDGNMQEGIAIVTVLDTIPPTIMCLENITQTSCDDAVAASYFIPTVNDNCPTVGPVVLTAGVPPGGILTAGTTTISYQFTDLGGNTVTCSFDYTLVTSETIEISIDSLLPASGANSDGAISISVTSGIAPFTFVWSANNLTVSTEEDPTGLSAGNYQVEITDSLGCETLFDVELLSTSTQDPTLLRKFQVYPNPTAGDLFVQLDFPVKAGNRIQVFALDGQLVLEQNLNDGEQLINLDLNRFNSGVYILKMTAEENVLTKRIVVQ